MHTHGDTNIVKHREQSRKHTRTHTLTHTHAHTRAKDAHDFQKRSRLRFPAARASRYALHPTHLVANAFALRVFNASYTFSFRKKEGKKERK